MTVHVVVVELVPASVLLRGVHRHVGPSQERLGVVRLVREQRDADGPRDVEREPLDAHGDLELFEEPVGDPHRDVLGRQLREDDAELIAPEPRHQVVVAEHAGQSRTDLLQEQITEVMPERVVDLLEVVEVDQHHGELPADPPGSLDRVGELELEQHPVGHPRERVVQRLVFVLGLFLGELVRRLLERVRPLEHLPRERERRGEHEDREHAQVVDRRRDEHGEQCEGHVRQHELAEDTLVHLADRREDRGLELEMVIRGDEEGVERIADDRRKQRRQDQLPRGTFQHVSERGMEVPGHRVVEDRGLGDHAERDLRPDEHGLERWDLALELAGIRRAEERDGRRGRRGEQQRRGQLQREAQAESHRDVRRHREEFRDHHGGRPREHVPIGEHLRVRPDGPDQVDDDRDRDEQLVEPDHRSTVVRAPDPARGSDAGLREVRVRIGLQLGDLRNPAPRGSAPAGSSFAGASHRRSRRRRPCT